METRDANSILQMLCAAYPTYPVGEDTTQLYIEILVQRDAEATLIAARNWIVREPHFPRISELVAAIRTETAHAAALALPPAPTPAGPRMSLEELRAMRPKGLTHARHGHRSRRDAEATD